MKVLKELNLASFDFWSCAKDHKFTFSELEELENQFEDIFCEEIPTETDINDMFWFEEELLCEWIGINFNEYLKR